jgi:hypothetical protein
MTYVRVGFFCMNHRCRPSVSGVQGCWVCLLRAGSALVALGCPGRQCVVVAACLVLPLLPTPPPPPHPTLPILQPHAPRESFFSLFPQANYEMFLVNSKITQPHHWGSRYNQWVVNSRGLAYWSGSYNEPQLKGACHSLRRGTCVMCRDTPPWSTLAQDIHKTCQFSDCTHMHTLTHTHTHPTKGHPTLVNLDPRHSQDLLII